MSESFDAADGPMAFDASAALLPSPYKEAMQRVAALERAITEHNDGLEECCEARQGYGSLCKAYISRGRACTDCPREWKVDLP